MCNVATGDEYMAEKILDFIASMFIFHVVLNKNFKHNKIESFREKYKRPQMSPKKEAGTKFL